MNVMIAQAPSLTNSNLATFETACTLANARGAAGVRSSCGMGGFGGTARISAASLAIMTTGITFAANAGLSKVSVQLSFSPRRDGAYLVGLNGGSDITVQSRPPAGTGNGIWLWLVQAWQDVIDTCRAAAIAAGQDPTTFLEFELANEINKGGISGPKNASGVYVGVYGVSMHYGAIEADWFTMAAFVTSRVNFHGSPTCMTLEGDTSDSDRGTDSPAADGIADYLTEIASFTGADAISFLGYLTHLTFNKYASAPSTPYDAAAVKVAFSTKIQTQVDAMDANANITGKAKNLREFGIKANFCPPCTTANQIRNDLIAQVKVEANISEGCLYTLYNLTPTVQTVGSDYSFYSYELDGTPRLIVTGQHDSHISF